MFFPVCFVVVVVVVVPAQSLLVSVFPPSMKLLPSVKSWTYS